MEEYKWSYLGKANHDVQPSRGFPKEKEKQTMTSHNGTGVITDTQPMSAEKKNSVAEWVLPKLVSLVWNLALNSDAAPNYK